MLDRHVPGEQEQQAPRAAAVDGEQVPPGAGYRNRLGDRRRRRGDPPMRCAMRAALGRGVDRPGRQPARVAPPITRPKGADRSPVRRSRAGISAGSSVRADLSTVWKQVCHDQAAARLNGQHRPISRPACSQGWSRAGRSSRKSVELPRGIFLATAGNVGGRGMQRKGPPPFRKQQVAGSSPGGISTVSLPPLEKPRIQEPANKTRPGGVAERFAVHYPVSPGGCTSQQSTLDGNWIPSRPIGEPSPNNDECLLHGKAVGTPSL